MNKQKPFILIFLLILVGFASFLYYNSNKAMTDQEGSGEHTGSISLPNDANLTNTYTSPRFGYSLSYPDGWYFVNFDEEDPAVTFGTHSLINYDPDQVQNFMDHGMVDWNSFLGNKTAIKVDMNVYEIESKERFIQQYFADADEQVSTNLAIGDLPTIHYITTSEMTGEPVNSYVAYLSDTEVVWLVVLTENDQGELTESNEWSELQTIFSSFSI